ncbi:MAG: cupredoxin domain-containing protein, partial [Bdellovibrionaceae bacterium]|nr:cupredoxin domain-containing protein [Pseudobdellovibrionaceae bacterium]
LNTEKGFVPETIRVKKGSNYRVHIVNVNQKEKNISFVLDAFSEHHNTVYGQERTFNLNPKVDGIFSYQCPETAVQGRVIVISDGPSDRKPASK